MYSGPKKVHTTSDEEIGAPQSLQMTESDTMEQDEVKSETEASSVNDDQEGDSDDSVEGWITPENLHEACIVMGGALTEEPNDIAVGCITTDFAMQVHMYICRKLLLLTQYVCVCIMSLLFLSECYATNGPQCHFCGRYANQTAEDVCLEMQSLLQVSGRQIEVHT